MKKLAILLLGFALVTTSCVSKKKFMAMQDERDQCQTALAKCNSDLDACNKKVAELGNEVNAKMNDLKNKDQELSSLRNRNSALEKDMEYMKGTNTNLLNRLEDLSIVSKQGAESIKKSLETMDSQFSYIKDLSNAMARKDSLNMALVMNIKRSLADVNDKDIQVEVKQGVVYISISDALLFRTASASINNKAEGVLAKIAAILNDHATFSVLVEGHTDNVPISNDCMADNWDLSTKRATAVVRYLQNKYKVDPKRMTAAGRSEFVPKDANNSAAARANNRRTEIILTPQLEQFFSLLEKNKK